MLNSLFETSVAINIYIYEVKNPFKSVIVIIRPVVPRYCPQVCYIGICAEIFNQKRNKFRQAPPCPQKTSAFINTFLTWLWQCSTSQALTASHWTKKIKQAKHWDKLKHYVICSIGPTDPRYSINDMKTWSKAKKPQRWGSSRSREILAACFHVGLRSCLLLSIDANMKVLGWLRWKILEATEYLTFIAKMKMRQMMKARNDSSSEL